ncbi:integrin alpha-X-like isoform X2 [Hemicordylus capensis]|uniref:integrin alpha-X-like isoform X2 n=1 Tax=Hemicordylus capensis TaxID=884348 RepID=UPI00230389C6|nr:integrin alpha-X-like isoform X2 [Hemicordylus capensis]
MKSSPVMDFPPLLFYLSTVLVSCCGFSVDVDMPTIFKIQTQSFGSSVAQTRNAVLVGAPLQMGNVNETGHLYQCTYSTGACQKIAIQRPADAVNMSLGLFLTARDSQVLVCGPTVHRACGNNMYINGYCFLLNQNLQQIQRFPDSLPECTHHPTDIVFLIDGSGSISSRDFQRMKVFVAEVIRRLSGRGTKFALVQFSSTFMEHFDFRTSNPADHVMDISQIQGGTSTATAIRRVVRETFVQSKGSRNGATKILLVITDGEKTDSLGYWTVIPEAERAGIIRYAIGVGSAFSSSRARQELNDIASEPDAEHVFAVHDFTALRGIQDQLQSKIFAIEGTQSQSSSSFQMEMSQEGFSALLTLDGSILGAVGAYDWAGGVFLYQNRNQRFINISSTAKDMNDAYLGYSSQLVQLNGRSGFVLGAPRYNYVGKMVLFERHAQNGEWQLKMEAVGEQEEALDCSTTLKGQLGHVFGRFGASMVEIGDITGDGWTDVAIGAPMEDENMGALYIFLGKRMSINHQYSQRIEGLRFSGGLFYFGQAVSGGTDLTGDGLVDIAVGRQTQVLLLRSRPVLRVGVSIEFQPPLIPTSVFQCQEQGPLDKAASMVKACFTVSKATQDSLGELLSYIQYGLALDSGRTKIRASFSTKSSVLTADLEIGLESKCENYWIELPICIEDTLTPITLRLNYSLVGKPITKGMNLRPVLSKESQQVYVAELPFEKNCGSDGKCEDTLQTSFNFSGLGTLVVGMTPEINVTASIKNQGEDSYRTTLQFSFPAGVSYRKVTLLQPSRKVVSVRCNSAPASEEDASRNATCSVNHPIFWSRAEAVFVATFDVSPEVDLGDTLRMVAKANSENGGNITKDMVHQAELPVKYAVYIIATALEESTKYVNFTTGQEERNKSVEHRYEVKNLRQRSIPISVMFQIPVKLKGIPMWDMSQVIPSQPALANCILERETPGSMHFQEMEPFLVNCSIASCKMIRCNISSLKMGQPLQFTIKGNISFQWIAQTQQKKVTLVSSAQIFYDEKKYYQKEGFAQSQVQMVVERIEIYNYLPVIIGSTIGGLVLLALIAAALYKVGFFKRQYKEMLNVAEADNEATNPPTQATDSSSPSKDADH